LAEPISDEAKYLAAISYTIDLSIEYPKNRLQMPNEDLRLLSFFDYTPHSILSAWIFWSYARLLQTCDLLEQRPTAEVKWDEKLKWWTLYAECLRLSIHSFYL